jgi:uncharacterized protein YjbJ (UPF0337 family)
MQAEADSISSGQCPAARRAIAPQEQTPVSPVNTRTGFIFRRVDAMDKDRIAGSAKEFGGKVESAAGDLAGDTSAQTSGRAREAAGVVQDLYGQAKDSLRDATDTAVSYAKGANPDAVVKLVRANPIQSLFVAGGIGFALALLLSRPARQPQRRARYY